MRQAPLAFLPGIVMLTDLARVPQLEGRRVRLEDQVCLLQDSYLLCFVAVTETFLCRGEDECWDVVKGLQPQESRLCSLQSTFAEIERLRDERGARSRTTRRFRKRSG